MDSRHGSVWRPHRAIVRACFLIVTCLVAPGLSAAEASSLFEGRLQVYQVDDFASGRFTLLYELEDPATGERVSLQIRPELAKGWSTGMTVKVEAVARAGSIEVRRVVSAAFARSDSPGGEAAHEGWTDAVPAQVVGARRALIMVADFQDSAVSCSTTQIASTMWTGAQSVDGLYQETSYGLVSFPSDTDNNGQPDILRVSVPHSIAESCDSAAWASSANSAATSAGVNLGNYQHLVYVLPGNTNCSWAGLGTVGCSGQCRTWVATCGLPDVYAHELGHNLGMHHASTDDDNDGTFDCEYCDRSDFMGIGGVGYRQVNGPHKLQMGWLSTAQLEDITGAPDQTAVISALTTAPGQALSPHALTYTLGGGDAYYLTYRARTGYDADLGEDYASKLNIHRFAGSGRTLFVAALSDGEVFNDPATGLTVTQLTHSSSDATVLVGSGCLSAEPTFSWESTEGTGEPGQAIEFSGVLTNADPGDCGAVTFSLSGAAPSGWLGQLTPTSVTLASGESADVSWNLTPPLGSPDGPSTATLSVSGAAPAHDFAETLTYHVAADAPAAVIDLAGAQLGKGFVVLRWTAPPISAAAIVGYQVSRDGSALGTSQSPLFVDSRPCGLSTCRYRVRSLDAAGRLSAESNEAVVNIVPSRRKGSDPGMR